MPPKPKQNYKTGGKDDFQTEPCAVDINEKHILPDVPIWEPACGEGYLASELSTRGFNVFRQTDLKTGHDFFDNKNWMESIFLRSKTMRTKNGKEFDQPQPFQIITNPPFSLKKEFVQTALHWGYPFQFLMPADTFFAGWFTNLIEDRHRFKILLPSDGKRINYKSPVYGWQWQVLEYDTNLYTKEEALKDLNLKLKTTSSQFASAWYVNYGIGMKDKLPPGITVEIVDASHWTKEYRESFWY